MPKYKVEMVLSLIVEADNNTEAIDKVNKYLNDHASDGLNAEIIFLDSEQWYDDGTPTDIE